MSFQMPYKVKLSLSNNGCTNKLTTQVSIIAKSLMVGFTKACFEVCQFGHDCLDNLECMWRHKTSSRLAVNH